MDEKRTNSSPSNNTSQQCNETISADRTFDAQTSGDAPDGDWIFVTQSHYDPDGPRDLTTVIISAIAVAEDTSIIDIKSSPLYEDVDIAGIDDALFGRPEANRSGTESTVEFRYNQYKVSIEADGWVTVSNRSLDVNGRRK